MGAPPVTPVLRTPANDDAKKQELYVLLIIDVPAHSRVSVRAPLPAPPATSSAVCSPRLSQGCSPATEVRRGRRRRRDVRAPPSFQANMHTAQKGGGPKLPKAPLRSTECASVPRVCPGEGRAQERPKVHFCTSHSRPLDPEGGLASHLGGRCPLYVCARVCFNQPVRSHRA